jgi:hypothetical protein
MLSDGLISIIRDLTRMVDLAFSLRSLGMMSSTDERQQPARFRPQQISPISEMTDDQRTYQAYLLRLWRVNIGRSTVWHASLEDSRSGERKGFADLSGLQAFLEEQTSTVDQPSTNVKGDTKVI